MMTEKLNSGHTNLTSKGFVYFIYIYLYLAYKRPTILDSICMLRYR